jgi:hypothetical protein
VSRELESGPAPAELDVRVMLLGLGEQCGSGHEPERIAEVVECELPPERTVAVSVPVRDLRSEPGCLLLRERRRPFLAGLAVLFGKIAQGGSDGTRTRGLRRDRPAL